MSGSCLRQAIGGYSFRSSTSWDNSFADCLHQRASTSTPMARLPISFAALSVVPAPRERVEYHLVGVENHRTSHFMWANDRRDGWSCPFDRITG